MTPDKCIPTSRARSTFGGIREKRDDIRRGRNKGLRGNKSEISPAQISP
jgi:hypothetical protein